MNCTTDHKGGGDDSSQVKTIFRAIDRRYSISNKGDVVNCVTGRMLKKRFLPTGYEAVNLYLESGLKTCLIHRLLAEAFLDNFEATKQVDHINGDRSDNRIENLRMTTAKQNARGYRKSRKGASSEFRGVSWNRRINRWLCKIVVDAKEIYIGVYKDEIEAAKAFDVKAKEVGYPDEGLNFGGKI